MTSEICTLHEDAFYEYFLPYRHPSASYDIWGGHGLETFGDDLKIVHNIDKESLWTVVDGDSGRDVWIIPGYHYINRICYLVTERAHGWIPIQFRVPFPPSSLTTIGLRRQVTKIERLLSVNGMQELSHV